MSSGNETRGLALPELIGFVGPIVALVCIFTAIALSPWFTWANNALSDLGKYSHSAAAVVFNAGLITTGVLMMYFVVSKFQVLKDWPTRLALFILVVSLGFLVCIGVFSEDFGDLHFFVSVGFFASFPFAMWAIALSWLRFRNLRWFSLVSFLLPFLSLYMWTAYFGGVLPWTGDAIPEILTASTAIGWIWVIDFVGHKGMLSRIEKT